MRIGRLSSALAVILLASVSPVPAAFAQDHDMRTAAQHDQTPEQQKQLGALVKIVRDATERFRDVPSPKPKATPCNSAASPDRTRARWGCTS